MEKTQDINLDKKIKAIIIGATGATGRELTDLLLKSDYYSKVTVLVRRKIDRWSKLSEKEMEKLNIILTDDLGVLNKDNEEISALFNNDMTYDTVFCCLGSRVGKGDEFRRVDFDFVVYSAILCEKFSIPHFSLVSSKGADPKSWFKYFKIKGMADEECLKRDVRYISVFRPGAILDRDNDDRFGEKCLKFIPFIDKIKSSDLARSLMIDDINYHIKNKIKINEKENKFAHVITHSDIEALLNEKI
jgi:oxidoreductase